MSARVSGAATGLRRVAMVLVLLAMLLGFGNREAPAAERLPELDVLVAVDRTTSMSALDDPSGSRITAVRRDLAALGDQLDTVRFSLVTFGERAEVELPFTSDRVAYGDEVRTLQVEPADAGVGTSVGRPVQLLEAELDRAAAADPTRIPVLVLVTDGENTTPEDQESFVGVGERVTAALVLGYGSIEGGVMPVARVALGQQPPAPTRAAPLITVRETGEPARSRLDEDNLRSIAGELGAEFVHSEGTQDMAALAAELERAAYADLEPGQPERELRWVWAILLIGLVLPELRTGWRGFHAARREGRS
jgi:Ca-activated chloride channel family protein